ncbi:MAG: chorismate mutase [Chlorobiaceae bacterium]|nr:chorismate mutase [Chlorobiaceae bacterium]NTV59944.1 chorismate mutase [Chlorobiaceae bacterium]
MMSGSNDNTDHRLEIDDWRKKIDAIDQKLASLLCERLHCAQNISSLKSMLGEQVLQPEREKEVLCNVMNHADTPLTSQALEKIYRCILEESRLLQQEWKSFMKESSSS